MCIPNSIRSFLGKQGKLICSRDGFTLLELMVAVLVAIGVTAIAVPSLQSIMRRHAPEELISELQLAHISAIRQHRQVTVTFLFNTTQCRVRWFDDAGVQITKLIDLGQEGEMYVFDNNPLGGAQAPVNQFIFSPLGFVSVNPGGNVSGNIYLTNQDNTRQYQIQTTIAGGIDLNRYNQVANAWESAQ